MMALDEVGGGPEGNMNVCTEFHRIPSNSILEYIPYKVSLHSIQLLLTYFIIIHIIKGWTQWHLPP